MKSNQTKIIILGVVVIILVIIVLLFSRNQNLTKNPVGPGNNGQTGDIVSDTDNTKANTPATPEEINAQYALSNVESLKDAQIEVVGASPVGSDNKVMTYEGEVADNSAAPGSALAPKRTADLSQSEVPGNSLKLSASASGFSPKEIKTTAGVPTTIVVSSVDDQVHVFMFDDPSLKAIAIGVMPGETKAITFNAPSAGQYTFRCDVPEHKDRGETGVMIVR